VVEEYRKENAQASTPMAIQHLCLGYGAVRLGKVCAFENALQKK